MMMMAMLTRMYERDDGSPGSGDGDCGAVTLKKLFKMLTMMPEKATLKRRITLAFIAVGAYAHSAAGREVIGSDEFKQRRTYRFGYCRPYKNFFLW